MKISSIVLLLVASAASCDAAVNCSDEPRACPALCGPVCGSDGKSYSNSCELDWAACDDKNLTKTSDGVCPNDANWDSQRCESKPSGGSSSAPGPVGSGGNDVEMPPSSTVSPGSGGSRSDGSSSPPSAVGSSSNDKKAVPQPSSDASVSVAAWGIMVGVLASASLVM